MKQYRAKRGEDADAAIDWFGVIKNSTARASTAFYATRFRAPLAVSAVLVGLFAIFPGHAHGVELPNAAHPLAYGVGFITATGLLHLSGILIGALSCWPLGERLIQALGAAIAALGCYF
jgi:urease accessory protein